MITIIVRIINILRIYMYFWRNLFTSVIESVEREYVLTIRLYIEREVLQSIDLNSAFINFKPQEFIYIETTGVYESFRFQWEIKLSGYFIEFKGILNKIGMGWGETYYQKKSCKKTIRTKDYGLSRVFRNSVCFYFVSSL